MSLHSTATSTVEAPRCLRTPDHRYARRLPIMAALAAVALVTVLGGPGVALGQDPPGDYGDAPDCPGAFLKYPTGYSTTSSRVGQPGAHHLITGEEALGLLADVSVEAGAEDPADPDGLPNFVCPFGPFDQDFGDDGVYFLEGTAAFSHFFGLDRVTWWAWVMVSVDPAAPPGPRYLNVLVDLNRDGQWGNWAGDTEWVMQNLPVNASGGVPAMRLIELGDHFVGSGPTWIRFTLTREKIDEDLYSSVFGWDGSGTFAYGETEDYFVDLEPPPGGGGSGTFPQPPHIQPPDPPCNFFLTVECTPKTARNKPLLIDHCEADPDKRVFGYHLEAGQGTGPQQSGDCYVELIGDQLQNAPPGVANIPDAQIGPLQDATAGWVGVNVGHKWPPAPGNLPVGGPPLAVDLAVQIDPDCDPPAGRERRSRKLTFGMKCCDAWQLMKQQTCGAEVWHSADNNGGLMEEWYSDFVAGQGQPFDPITGFGFGYNSPQADGDISVQVVPARPLYLNPGGPAIGKSWAVAGDFDVPLENPPTDSYFTEFVFEFSDADLMAAGIPTDDVTKSLLVVGRHTPNNFGDLAWSLNVGQQTVVDVLTNQITIVYPNAFGVFAIGLPTAFQQVVNDCDSNGIDDYVDIYVGRLNDCDGNNIPDECDLPFISAIDALGGPHSFARAINNNGQVVGEANTGGSTNGLSHAFLWEGGPTLDLGTLGGGFSEALDINNYGQIIGQSTDALGRSRAFIWQQGQMTDLGTLG
ncbi:MAG: hypothetical protein IID40_06740, partial [Planctomycetes bacterium]|nr:hypothetical protein [Planctomycetota bacterium]